MVRKIRNHLYRRKYFNALGKIAEFRNIEGWLTDREAYGLYNIARKLSRNCKVVEIGSWKGKSTFCIAKGIRKGTIYAIDPFNADGEDESKGIYSASAGSVPLIDQFRKNLSDIPPTVRIEPLEGYSSNFRDRIDSFNMLFIDGDHSFEGCLADYQNYAGKLEKGGFLVFHDYDPVRKDLGPTRVIEEYIINDPQFRHYRNYDSLWVGQKL